MKITDIQWVSSRKQGWSRSTHRRPVSIRVRMVLLQNWRAQFLPSHQMTRPSNNLQKAMVLCMLPTKADLWAQTPGSNVESLGTSWVAVCRYWNSPQKVHACKQVAIFNSEEMNRPPPTYFLRNLGTPKQSKNEISSMFQTSENTPNKICWN